MKKFLILFAALTLSIALTGCETTVEVPMELPELPEVVDMTNVDDYLGRPDVQYVDLRNFDDKMNSGYIAGFEFIPFFEYLEYSNILVRTNAWTFETASIKNAAALEGLFDMDKTIFLMCGSGTRAGFVKDALDSLGYTTYNVGGITNYAGEAKVLGDGTYNLVVPKVGPYTPGTYFAVDPQTQYTTSIVVGANGAIESVVFDALYHGTTKNTLDAAYTLGSGVTWKSEADLLAAYVLANQGWGEIVLDVTDITGMNALTAPNHFIRLDRETTIDPETSPDAVAGVSIGAEGFVLSWNLAIAMATEAGTLGVIPNVPTSDEWVAAHAPAFNYVDGQYFGMDEDSGYSALVTIEGGVIVDVFFDAIRLTTHIEYDVPFVNNNGTKTDLTDDFDDVKDVIVVDAMTTKQALQEAYTLGSGITWAAEADELAEAIIDAQEWSDAWLIISGSKELFDMTDTTTADAVGGVTIGLEGFMIAFEEAMEQATPAS